VQDLVPKTRPQSFFWNGFATFGTAPDPLPAILTACPCRERQGQSLIQSSLFLVQYFFKALLGFSIIQS
jgi:hypothetical protein